MDAAQALADLTEISSQIVQVAIIDSSGSVLASTIADEARAKGFVDGVTRLVAEAQATRASHGLPGLSQLEAATLGGSVFVVLGAERMIAAITRPEPTVGLVFYDLKHCLRSIEDGGKQRAAPRRKKADASA